MSAYNRCGENAIPKRVNYLEFIKFQTARYSWPHNYFIRKINSNKWGAPTGATSGQATTFRVYRKHGNPTASEPIRSGEIVTFAICRTQDQCKKDDVWAGGKGTPDMKSGHPNTDRNYIMTKIAGYGYPDDKTLYYGDTINIYHDNGKTGYCKEGLCTGQVICSGQVSGDNECRILEKSQVDNSKYHDLPNQPNEFRIFNINGDIPCEGEPSEKCSVENCPASICTPGNKGICANGKRANCDENTGTWTCPCDNDDECPSNRECDSSNRCVLKEGSGCTGDDDCKTQGFKYCLNERCIDCKSNDDCDENLTCSSSGECTQKISVGTVILLAILGLALLTGVYFVLRGILKKRREKQEKEQHLEDFLFLDDDNNDDTTASNQVFTNTYSDLNPSEYIQHVCNDPNVNIYDNTIPFHYYYPYQTVY